MFAFIIRSFYQINYELAALRKKTKNSCALYNNEQNISFNMGII